MSFDRANVRIENWLCMARRADNLPFYLDSGDFLVRLPPSISVQDVKTPEWFNLNHLVSTFSSTIPMQEAPQDGKVDSVRLVADLLIHTCALQLHEPLARLDENSVQMCKAACTGVVNTLRVSKIYSVCKGEA